MINQLVPEDINRLIVHASEPGSGSTSRQMIIMGIYTDMRLHEIQALTWDDVDLDKGTISIDKSWDDITHTSKSFKIDSLTRTITINDQLINLLKNIKENSQNEMVFMDRNQKIPTTYIVNKVLSNLLSDLKINPKGFHFHDLKHCQVDH